MSRSILSVVMTLSLMLAVVHAAAVTIQVGPGLTYNPAMATANVGDTITWQFQAAHTVTQSDTQGSCTPSTMAGAFTSGTMASGNYTHVFATAGTYYYFCAVPTHCQSGMTGSITILAAGASPSSAMASGASPSSMAASGAMMSASTSAMPTSTHSGASSGFGSSYEKLVAIFFAGLIAFLSL